MTKEETIEHLTSNGYYINPKHMRFSWYVESEGGDPIMKFFSIGEYQIGLHMETYVISTISTHSQNLRLPIPISLEEWNEETKMLCDKKNNISKLINKI